MEPAAPGTEDDPPIDFGSLKMKENEQERVLKQKAILKNGQYDNVFELSFVNGAEHWFCRICQCPVMGRVYQHEIGRRHTTNMAMTNRQKINFKPPSPVKEEPILEVAPGEPVPPGFEGEVTRQAQIQERLDGFKVGPLVALEYVLEMQDYDVTKEPLYLCILCDKRGDPRTVLTHLASYNHISQYLQKHFPTCYRALAPYMTKHHKRNWQLTLQKIAEAIEKKFGRLKPFPIEKDKFEKDRLHYLTMICKGKHFSELSGHSFQELVVHEELTKVYTDDDKPEQYTQPSTNWGGKNFIEKPFQKRSPSPPVVQRPGKKSKPETTSQNNTTATPAAPKSLERNTNIQKRPSPQRRVSPGRRRDRAPPGTRRRSASSLSSLSSSDGSAKDDFRRVGGDRRGPRRSPNGRFGRDNRRVGGRRSVSPPRRPVGRDNRPWPERQEFSRRDDGRNTKEKEKERLEKLQEFTKLCKAIESDLDKTYKVHDKNPEKHPKYNDEWKKFWNRRYKELQAAGKDASKYDFKPEWIEFWGKRMHELHQEELKERKEALRKRLGMPEEPPPVSFRISDRGKPIKPIANRDPNKPSAPMAAQPDNDPEIIVIDDKEDRKRRPSPPPRRPSPRRGSPPPPRRVSPRRPSPRRPSPRRPSPRRSPPKRGPSRRSASPWERESPHRNKSPIREKPKVVPRQRSPPSKDQRRSRSPARIQRDKSRSIERRQQSRGRSRSLEKLSRSPGRDYQGRPSRERSYETKREYRESSYERDLRARERVRTIRDLPWEREKMMYPYEREYDDYYKPPPIMRDVSRKPMHHGPIILPEDDDDEAEVNIVSVLRLLTALEERLGSLGPKIIDLLAQALALEKKEANSSETLLDNEINCVMFETVKEKLKGQLLAGMVDLMEERPYKKAIKKTAALIHMAGQRKRHREQLRPKAEPVTVPGVGTVDKAAIAKQIANALIAQGKTDVTQAELEQLINAVVGMAEARKNSDKPITTASFLEQIAAGGATTSTQNQPPKESKEFEEKIIIPSSSKKEKPTEIIDLEKLTEPLSPESPERFEERSSTANMENLSDSDLQTLLQNFKDLSTEEQMNLINYLKKLEQQEPERVEKLRKFVNLGSVKTDEEKEQRNKDNDRDGSPFSMRIAEANEEKSNDNSKGETKVETKKIHLDSEDEDYSFEDVVKAVKDKEIQSNRKLVEDSIQFSNKSKEIDLTDAKALISNLMSSFTNTGSSINLLGLAATSSAPMAPPTPTISVPDLSKTIETLTQVMNSGKPMILSQETIRPANPPLLNKPILNLLGPRGGPQAGPGPARPPLLGAPSMGFGQRQDNRNLVQYPTRLPNPYGNSFQGGGNFPQQNVAYPSMRPRGAPPMNQRFGGPNQFGQRGNYNRW